MARAIRRRRETRAEVPHDPPRWLIWRRWPDAMKRRKTFGELHTVFLPHLDRDHMDRLLDEWRILRGEAPEGDPLERVDETDLHDAATRQAGLPPDADPTPDQAARLARFETALRDRVLRFQTREQRPATFGEIGSMADRLAQVARPLSGVASGELQTLTLPSGAMAPEEALGVSGTGPHDPSDMEMPEEDDRGQAIVLRTMTPVQRRRAAREARRTASRDRNGEALDDAGSLDWWIKKGADVVREGVGGILGVPGRLAEGAGELYGATGRRASSAVYAGLEAAGATEVVNILQQLRIPEAADPANALQSYGNNLQDVVEGHIRIPEEQRDFVTDVAYATGSMSAQITAAVLSGGASRIVSTLMAASEGAAEQAERATRYNASGTGAGDAGVVLGAGISALLERYGLDTLLGKLPTEAQNTITQTLANATIETAQNVAETVAQNLAAVALYAPDLPIFEGTLYEGLVAGTAKALTGLELPNRGVSQTDQGTLDGGANSESIHSEKYNKK